MTQPAAHDLDARYGRTPGRRRRRTVLAIVAGTAAVALSVAWVVWVGLFGADSSLEVRDLGYTQLEGEVTVRWELTAEPGRTASCAVEALNATHAIVGWRIVDIPASEARTRPFRETIRVTEPAVTGLISECWLT
ncbi:DUF4307 domain-containing protein [Homoserinibacter sp. YIM 151385]|uniref:DUF4307 domain-containing protein n=1 Tax=Homoserinibacter sp. YIM 151385 TaxID=2985506 RepID=UPI0022F03070|nr:DUF4307 domain-containing protein [Homoserinibacter sp. YIM 151385]WBU38063.1 DUF4307 domain-containing protein [Homoserinibacter sp. YIM 151385]